ncbi:hypothetical protein SEA_DONNY_88 [Mycobacterium phage Donny]|uniref:Uncharacterized protein n=3 Tax=Acadianvirus acadian TaxID=1982901 RepID=A0A7M1CMF9_9CAUD|nr:hypothetical protein CM14_gp88 [Mycobacterium phage Acadian]AER49001.1 hypothetical protein ACADIAN_88 [Mycobacterium phage Acadian]QBI96446.1 hypothetical protein SEA_DONNY_88 [Mycobacterium phage Donny]QOP65630.1 hypothetical protein SEA_SUIGENERIS_89 [Mycobacterium phage Suigeneris]WUT94858.1 hypothetical protein PRODRIGUEZ_88 [Mycobacterium phage PRodriguez]
MANDTAPATEPRFPNVTVQLTGNDGNVFLIIGRVQRALLSGGATREQATEFVNEVTDADSYDAALAVVMRWVEVS